MKIRYKKSFMNWWLVLVLFDFIFTFLLFFIWDSKSSIKYFCLFQFLIFSGLILHAFFYQYLTMENGHLQMNDPRYRTKINLANVKQIKKMEGELIIKAEKKDLSVNTFLIEPDSLSDLLVELEKLEVEWT
ncbi:MAG TPA: hypothetical protein VKX30_08025 [Flavobacteriaceae bacterium]|nr:hypothetical protein [Flavobacteriaceae bacterium]